MTNCADKQALPGLKRNMVSRADLIECLGSAKKDAATRWEQRFNEQAALFGFYPDKKKKKGKTEEAAVETVASQRSAVTSARDYNDLPKSTPTQNIPKASFYYAKQYQIVERDESVTQVPQWVKDAKSLGPDDGGADPDIPTPTPLPLMPWPRLWPFLRLALGDMQRTRTIDVERLVRCVSEGRVLRRLPYTRRKGWAGTCCLLIDFSEQLLPFWDDFNRLCELVGRMRGRTGLQIFKLEDGPNGPCRPYGDAWSPKQEFIPPPPGTPVLVLSDLGCLREDKAGRRGWQRFGRRLQRAGLRPIALLTCPPRLWDNDLTDLFFHACWDRDARLPKRVEGRTIPRGVTSDLLAGPEQLLELLAPAIRVEPALLRAARHLLPAASCDVGCEAAAWNHRDVVATPLAFFYKDREKIEYYRKAFKKKDETLRNAVATVVKKYHDHLPEAISCEERYVLDDLCGTGKVRGKELMQRVVKTLADESGDAGLHAWVRRVGSRLHPSMWRSRALSAAWALVHKDELDKGVLGILPPGFELNNVAWVLGERLPARKFSLHQLGENFVVTSSAKSSEEPGKEYVERSPVVDITCNLPVITVKAEAPSGKDAEVEGINIGKHADLPLSLDKGFKLRTDNEIILVERIERPEWAEAMGRDEYGLYADFAVHSVRQRMRWISPGRFLMGSPEDEPERSSDERQHEVILSKGFWLADTACTQELWRAVMGENPSRFKDDERLPVENVSWDDCQLFLEQINKFMASLDLRLPTEAEWEYACRAGSTTPFSFGENITTDEVNYDGSRPYAGGQKGKDRNKTVVVKSLPVNPWGLYEMHGNVWEWCSDWYAKYPRERVVDPTGPHKGVFRVLRGGSWAHRGGDARSAYRDAHGPADRDPYYGFRLARGQ